MMNNILLEVQVGSRAYGYHTKESDSDVVRVTVPTLEELSKHIVSKQSPLLHSTQRNKDGVDILEIPLPHFLHLLKKGSPNALEVFLLARVQKPIYVSDFWKKIDNRVSWLAYTDRNVSSLYRFTKSLSPSRKSFAHLLKTISLVNISIGHDGKISEISNRLTEYDKLSIQKQSQIFKEKKESFLLTEDWVTDIVRVSDTYDYDLIVHDTVIEMISYLMWSENA